MSRLISRWGAAGWLSLLAWSLLLGLALAVPALMFIVDMQFHRGVLSSSAGARGWALSQRIAANPQHWRFEEVRLQAMIEQRLQQGEDGDRRAIVDNAGRTIVETGAVAAPVLEVREPLFDSGRAVADLVLQRSMRPLLFRAAWAATVSLALAAAAWFFLLRLPLRALRSAQQELEHKAFHDALTGLVNREAFRRQLDERLAAAARGGRMVAVLFIDLDRFKAINDTLGHDAGNEVLQAVARRLAEGAGPSDVVARLSGDEFAIAIPGLASRSDAALAAEAVVVRFAEPFVAGGRQWHLSCSVGVSVYPLHGREADRLLAYADTAMLHAKSMGRSASSVYSEEMQHSVARRVELEDDLRGALQRQEFELHYQPLWDLGSGRVKGAEALLRWRHPQRGLVPPMEFIPVLEDLGLIHAVGRWVMLQACRQWRAWADAGLVLQSVAVNVSALQFARGPEFVEQVRGVLAEAGIEAGRLQLELTEGILMSDSDRSLQLLSELKALRVSLAIDDFGTGYSSLAYLRRFPVDTLKVDRSFVREMSSNSKDLSIVRAVVQLAHNLGLAVTAEGIETADQLTALHALGCDTGQGYLLGRPQPAAALQQAHAVPGAAVTAG